MIDGSNFVDSGVGYLIFRNNSIKANCILGRGNGGSVNLHHHDLMAIDLIPNPNLIAIGHLIDNPASEFDPVTLQIQSALGD